ncbi:hypothetical protein IFM89_000795 [Coptis chinensis]|uniref:Defensin-like protein n=1 Tax=Coptis chinensis TaxID=261450 RepID=A0A835MGW8_9MAGN|nr:hypothetical protein IFM89_000795 [Coptis chinensis]
MAKYLPIVYILFALLALVSVEKITLKVNAATCYATLGGCNSEVICRQQCQQQHQGEGYCEVDAKPDLTRVCTCQYNC